MKKKKIAPNLKSWLRHCIYIHERANDLSQTSRIELIQDELTSFVQSESNLYTFLNYCIYELLIYFSNYINKQLSSSYTFTGAIFTLKI
jgi:hypothetical protein